jgi:hypothetical protein
MPAFCLRILRVLDLLPPYSVVLINPEFPLGNNSFQIPPADFLEQTDALIFDVLGVDDRVTPTALDQFVQPLLAIDERQRAQVVAFQPQQVEGIEDGLALAGHQFVESADAVATKADDLSGFQSSRAQLLRVSFFMYKAVAAITSVGIARHMMPIL